MISIDTNVVVRYLIKDVNKIVGILCAMVKTKENDLLLNSD